LDPETSFTWPGITFPWETCSSGLTAGKKRFGGDPVLALSRHATRAAHEAAAQQALEAYFLREDVPQARSLTSRLVHTSDTLIGHS
jgi:hypothetical protein